MPNTRYVKPNADGGWDVLKEGHRRASVQSGTRQGAVDRARRIVAREGGGEVRVLNSAGKIERANTVLKVSR